MDVTSLINFSTITVNNTTSARTPATISSNMTLDSTTNSDTMVFTLNPTAIAEIQATAARAADTAYTVSLAAATIKDATGINLGVTNTVALAYTKDAIAPTFTSMYNTADSILTLTFSEPMNGSATVPADTHLAIKKVVTGAFAQISAELDDLDGTSGASIVNPATVLTAGNSKWNADRTVLQIMLNGTEKTNLEAYDGLV